MAEAAAAAVKEKGIGKTPEFVYRISTTAEWEKLQKEGETYGGDLDKSTGCIHLSNLDQVVATLKNFFQGRDDLYLLQIDTKKVIDGTLVEIWNANSTKR